MNTPIEQLVLSPMSELYKEHISFIKAKNVEGLLDQYAEDLLLISTLTEDRKPLYVRGREELKAFFESRIFNLEDIEISLSQWAETPETLMMVENIKATDLEGGVADCRFYDNWQLENGKIKTHFAGVIQYPDGTYTDDAAITAQVPDSPLGALYKEHIGFIRDKNVEGLLSQYTSEPLLISTLTDNKKPLYVKGQQSLKEFFESRIFGLDLFDIEMNQWAEGKDALMVVETLKTYDTDGNVTGELSFHDSWALKDGKIATHFAGVVRYPDGIYQ